MKGYEMKHVLTNLDPPLTGITIYGHQEEVFTVADKLKHICRKFVTNQHWPKMTDEDLAEVTFGLASGHSLTKARVEQVIEEQGAQALKINYHIQKGNKKCWKR